MMGMKRSKWNWNLMIESVFSIGHNFQYYHGNEEKQMDSEFHIFSTDDGSVFFIVHTFGRYTAFRWN
jgi:hypothetical protein